MRISILPKTDLGYVRSKIVNWTELKDIILKYNYSLSTFNNNSRKLKYFRAASIIALDFDGGYKLKRAIKDFRKYKCIISTSRNHQKKKHGVISDRFRVILFLDKKIKSNDLFRQTWLELAELFPACDPQCKDSSRFYYPSTKIVFENRNGKLVKVSKLRTVTPIDNTSITPSVAVPGKLSVRTLEILKTGPKKGQRNGQTFKVAKDFQQNNYTLEQTLERIITSYKKAKVFTLDFTEFEVRTTVESAFKTENFFGPRVPFQLQKYSDLGKNVKEVKWVVDRLFMKSGLSLLSGVPKLGKSTIVRQLIAAILKREKFLGRQTEFGEVHYYAIEEDAATIKQSFKKLNLPPNENLLVHVGEIYSKNRLNDFFEILKQRKPVLAVVDTLFDFIKVESENNYSEVKREMKRLRNIARATGTHIVCVHHNSKSGFAQGNNQILGSQAITGGVDAIFLLTNVGETRIVSTSGRGIKKWTDRELIWDEKTETYKLGKEIKIEL